MKITPEALAGQLQKGLHHAYMISGDEPLLALQAAEHLRQTAKQQGYNDREVYHIDSGFDWNEVLRAGNSMSLFGGRKIIELRMADGKAGVDGGKVLEQLLQSPPEDVLLIVITGKLTQAQRKTKWHITMEAKAVCVVVKPLAHEQLPAWIAARLQQQGLKAEAAVVQMLADRVEGNLLAAQQEIDKLRLLSNKDALSTEDVMQAVVDSARYDIYQFIDAALAQRHNKLSTMLANVRAQGGEAVLVAWALAQQFRTLLGVAELATTRQNHIQFLYAMRTWKERQALVAAAARRHPPQYWRQCLLACGRVDRIIKGLEVGNVWDIFLQLAIKMAA